MPEPAERPRLERRHALVLAGLVLLSFNLRPAAVSVGPVLHETTGALGMSDVEAGLLTSLPVLAFAVFGALSPWLADRLGVHRVTFGALVAAVAGLTARVLVHDSALFLAWSLLALAGMAAANVLMPSLVKQHFPHRIGLVTSIYTTALAIGLTSALTLTVPISHAFGGWRAGLGSWAILAAVAAVPWLGLVAHDSGLDEAPRRIRLTDVARTRLGLSMALFFGLQSLQAYVCFGWFAQLWRDSGYSATTAGLLLGAIGLVSIPLSFWMPAYVARSDHPTRVVMGLLACYPLAYVGLLIAPHSLAVAWAVLTGIAQATFPVILVMIGLRSRTPEGTAALSGFTQSIGYLIAAAGPFTVGLVHDATGAWTWPLWFLIVTALPMFAVAAYVARPHFVEDQLSPRGARQPRRVGAK